mmetsp:Transcript_43312/g.51970  ORF Transcript_43312/g.51970 Transcript_43312/m.51970 type:complete len:133 (+) Transcript_43312:895-1293(+)
MEMLGETIQPMKESFLCRDIEGAFGYSEGDRRGIVETAPRTPGPARTKQKKRNVDGSIRPDHNLRRSVPIRANGAAGQVMKVIDDDLEDINEHSNSRQSFLNLCCGNHYQHTHLHDGPPACNREILTVRYHR